MSEIIDVIEDKGKQPENKLNNNNDKDGIESAFSHLPDAVISHILSFLPSQNDILSLRITNKWYNKNVTTFDSYTREAHDIWCNNPSSREYKMKRWIKMLQNRDSRWGVVSWAIAGVPCTFLIALAAIAHLSFLAFVVICCEFEEPISTIRDILGPGLLCIKTVRKEKADHDSQKYLVWNVAWVLTGGWLMSLVFVIEMALLGISIIGIPNILYLKTYPKYFLWPFGYKYTSFYVHVPPVDPRHQTLKLFLQDREREKKRELWEKSFTDKNQSTRNTNDNDNANNLNNV